MAATERLGGTPKATRAAIGRPLDPAWMDHFADVAHSILPSTAKLDMRKLPGVVYIPGDSLPRALSLETDDEDDRHIRLQKYSRAMIEKLCDEGKLDKQAAMSTIDVALHKPRSVGLKRPIGAYITMLVELDDTPNSSEENYGYQIEAERYTFSDNFHIKTALMPSTRQQPLYHVAIGRTTGFVPQGSLYEIGEALPGSVPLLGINALNLGYVS